MNRSYDMAFPALENIYLPPDVWKEIISFSKPSLVALSCVNNQFNQQAKDYAKNNLPEEGCFVEKDWKHYNGDTGIVCPIPLKMVQDFDASKLLLSQKL